MLPALVEIFPSLQVHTNCRSEKIEGDSYRHRAHQISLAVVNTPYSRLSGDMALMGRICDPATL